MSALSFGSSPCTHLSNITKFRRSSRRHWVVQVTARNRVLFYANEVLSGKDLRLSRQDERAQHLIKVLKVQPGSQVKVGAVNGAAGVATVLQISPDVVLQCLQWRQPSRLHQLHVVLAMPRPKVLKRLLTTLACLGVSHVHITGAEKVEPVYYGATALLPHNILPQLITGAEQAGDTMLPSVFFSRSLRKTIACVKHMTCSSLHNEALSGSWTHCLIPPDVDTLLTHPGNQAKALQSMQDETFKSAILKLSINIPAISRKLCNHDDDQAAAVAIPKPASDASGVSACCNELKVHSHVASTVPVRILAHVEGGLTVREAIKQQVGSSHNDCLGPVVLAIGPEGGWTADEVALLTILYGYQAATIAAGRTLDTATAVTALVSVISEVLTDQYTGSE